MSKHKKEFKLQLAKLSQENSSTSLSYLFNVPARQIRYWSSVYQIHGFNSFLHKELPYTQTFKINALETMRANGWTLGYTSAYFDLSSPGILFQWQKSYDDGGSISLIPRKKGRALMKQPMPQPKPSEQMTEQELRDELEYLRAENDVLKKLEALAQAREKKAKKRP